MVLQTERYPGGYHQNSYPAYQGPNGSYSNFLDVPEQTTPYSGYPQGSTYQSSHAPQHQSGWSTGGGYQSNGDSHYSGGGMGAHLKPTNGGYGSSPYNNPHSYGSPHGQSHGGPHSHGYGSPHGLSNGHGGPQSLGHGGYGNSHGYGGGAPNQFNKLTHGLNGYGNGTPNYGHNPSGMNNSYQKPTWDLKGLDDDDE